MRILKIISLFIILSACIIAFIDAKSSLYKKEWYDSNEVLRATYLFVREVADNSEVQTLHSMIIEYEE